MTTANPFTPSFGSVPLYMAGRDSLVSDIAQAMENGPGDPNLSTIFIGARGTGKTALLGKLAQEAGLHGWVSANVSALPGLLDDIYMRTIKGAAAILQSPDAAHIKAVQIAGLGGIEIERDARTATNFRSRLEDALIALEEKNSGLLITVDEVNPNLDELIQLASIYQHFVREGRRVALVMAGLPGQVSGLLADESVSFLRRACQHHFGRIPDNEIAIALKETIESGGKRISSDTLRLATSAIEGFPYMMQLVGYEMWRQNPSSEWITDEDVHFAIASAMDQMHRQVHDATYRELSARDREFVFVMARKEGEARLSDIAKEMGVRSNYASQYKSRLLEAGVIEELARGVVDFSIPGFRGYVREKGE